MGLIIDNNGNYSGYREEEHDRPYVEKAWDKRLQNMHQSNISIGHSNVAVRSDDSGQYNDVVGEVPSTLAYYQQANRYLLGDNFNKSAIKAGDVIADIGSRNTLELPQFLEWMVPDATLHLVDKSEETIKKISALMQSEGFDNHGATIDTHVSPADQLSCCADDSVDYLRFIRGFQQADPEKGELTAFANEIFRILKPGGQAVVADLDWHRQTTNNGRLNEFIERYSYKMGNPVKTIDPSVKAPVALKEAGLIVDRKPDFNIISPLQAKYNLWSGATRMAHELAKSYGYPVTQAEADSVAQYVQSIYDHNDIQYTMPIAITMAIKPS